MKTLLFVTVLLAVLFANIGVVYACPPSPEETPEATKEVKPTESPKEESTPKATEEIQPTESPEATEEAPIEESTPMPTEETPKVVETPAPLENMPIVVSTPETILIPPVVAHKEVEKKEQERRTECELFPDNCVVAQIDSAPQTNTVLSVSDTPMFLPETGSVSLMPYVLMFFGASVALGGLVLKVRIYE